MKKCVHTCGDDEPCQKPSYCGMAFLCGHVKFHRHPEKSCNRFPPFVGWRAIEIRAALLLGELLNFRQWNSTSRTKKFSVHAGMMSQTSRAVDCAAGGVSSVRLPL